MTPWSFISYLWWPYGAVPLGYPAAQAMGVSGPASFLRTQRLAQEHQHFQTFSFLTELFRKVIADFSALVRVIELQYQ